MSDSPSPRPRDKRDRKATEEIIINAFETVLLRDGVIGLGVNAVAQEAGVNKVLIYRYFQDLPGLARHWASNSSFWPDEMELIGNDPDAFATAMLHVAVNYTDFDPEDIRKYVIENYSIPVVAKKYMRILLPMAHDQT